MPCAWGSQPRRRTWRPEALRKLEQKHAAFIIANDVSRGDIGFGQLDNEVTVFRANGEKVLIPKASKVEIARSIFDLVVPAVHDLAAVSGRVAG